MKMLLHETFATYLGQLRRLPRQSLSTTFLPGGVGITFSKACGWRHVNCSSSFAVYKRPPPHLAPWHGDQGRLPRLTGQGVRHLSCRGGEGVKEVHPMLLLIPLDHQPGLE